MILANAEKKAAYQEIKDYMLELSGSKWHRNDGYHSFRKSTERDGHIRIRRTDYEWLEKRASIQGRRKDMYFLPFGIVMLAINPGQKGIDKCAGMLHNRYKHSFLSSIHLLKGVTE